MRSFRRKVYFLSGTAGVLLVANIIGMLFSPSFSARGMQPLFPGLRYDRAAELIIERPGESLRFRREAEDTWILASADTELPVQSAKIRTLVSVLGELIPYREVTSDPDLFGRFGLGEQGTARIVLRDERGRTTVQMTTGDLSPEGTGLYVKTARSDAVLLVNSELASYLRRDTRYWLRLRLFPEEVTPERIIRVQAVLNGPAEDERSFELVRVDDQGIPRWSLVNPSGAQLDQEQVNAYVVDLAHSEAADMLSVDNERRNTMQPAGSIGILTDRNRSYRVDILHMAGEESAFAVEIAGFRYRISREFLDAIIPPIGTWLETEKEQ